MSKYRPKKSAPSGKYADDTLVVLEKIEQLKLDGKHKESITLSQELLFKDPNCVAALEELADNYVSLDQYESAEKAAQHALKLDDKSYIAHYILGFIHSHRQEWSASLEDLSLANQLHPNNAEILRCLGWSMFNAGKRTQGIVILERALNLDGDNSLTLCDLGVCYLQTKDFEKAIVLLKKAIEIDPDNERIQECYRAAKNFSERYSLLTDKDSNKEDKVPFRRSFI